MAETIKLSGTYDSIEAYNILTQIQGIATTVNSDKTDAETAATNAGNYAGAAAQSALDAQGYAGNANTYAGNASNSANDAAGYAANAYTSETNAGNSATNAHNSEVAAASSEHNASISETNAASSASAAALAITPTGSVLAFAGSTSPTGWLLCDGSAVSRTDYAALFAVIGTTYGSGDGSTTFNLPNLTDKFIQGNSTSGTVKSAGLPNITGNVSYGGAVGLLYGNSSDSASGAFYPKSQKTGGTLSTTSGTSYSFGIDASRSSAIYGNSATVQPPAVTMRYIIKT